MKSMFTRILCLSLCLLLTGVLFACKEPVEETKPTYMVTFSKNIDDVTINDMPSPQNIEEGQLVTRPTKNPSTNLYSFLGWFLDSEGETPFNFDTVTVTKRMTIYAKWELKVTKYQVIFDLNYEGSSLPTQVEIIQGEKIIKPSDPVRPNYRFISWSTQANENYAFDFDNTITSQTNLYAIWEALYTLTFVFNMDSMNNEIVEYSENDSTVQITDPTQENYSFGGWFTNQDLNQVFTFGSKLDQNTTVYAKWVRTHYLVTFDLNYEGSTPIVVKANAGTDVPTPQTPTREGYVFGGWYTSKIDQIDDNLYDFGPVTNDTTMIYASWIKEYTVTFYLNYQDSGDPSYQIVLFGNEANTSTPTREGYLFGGWYKDALGEIVYDFGPVEADVVLYAKWIEDTGNEDEFTVTFDLNYTGSTPIVQLVVANTSASRPEDPVREGYQFSGWVTKPTGSTSYKFNAVTEDTVVYARWVNLWTITFNLGYDGAPDAQVIHTLDGTRITKPENPTREGLWHFVNWVDANQQPFIFTTVIKQDYELYAQWTPSAFTVTWDFNYEGAPENISSIVYIGTLAKEPEKPIREGNWGIVGWYLDEAGTIPFNINSNITEDIIVYAKWASGYAYRINLNYVGSPSIPTQIFSEGTLIPDRPVDPIRLGYQFIGWSTASNENPNFDSFNQPITSDITIYAQWQHTFIFEAEYVNLAGKTGAGWSGGASGTAMINKDTITEDPALGTNANASNGYFLSYLYAYGLYIDFVITSDRATTATLILRISAEQKDPFILTDNEYLITLNGTKVNYGSITIFGAYAALNQQKLPFEDVISVQVNLVEGINNFRFLTNNLNSMGGTMDATAPLIDCIKLDTIANLSWDPLLENLSAFN